MKIQMSKQGRLLLTREAGRVIGARFRKGGNVELDFNGVEVASPSFLGELLRLALAKHVTVKALNASPRIEETLDKVSRSLDLQASGS